SLKNNIEVIDHKFLGSKNLQNAIKKHVRRNTNGEQVNWLKIQNLKKITLAPLYHDARPVILYGVPPLAFPIVELRSAFDRIVLNAYLRAGLPRAMHEEPRVIAGIVDE
ncbi:hypothetical protein ALC53_13482, partial [Atta colombica]